MRVLVAEDDDGVRRLVQLILREDGHEVIAEATAEALIGRHSLQADLLITDVVLPGTSGPHLDALLRAKRPELRTLFISGFGYHPALARVPEGPQWLLLRKPFDSDALRQAIEDLFRAKPSSDVVRDHSEQH